MRLRRTDRDLAELLPLPALRLEVLLALSDGERHGYASSTALENLHTCLDEAEWALADPSLPQREWCARNSPPALSKCRAEPLRPVGHQ